MREKWRKCKRSFRQKANWGKVRTFVIQKMEEKEEKSSQNMNQDAGRKPMVRLWGTHWFSAVCEMCVFRYRQHSSRDKPLGPPSPHPHPPLSLHPPRRVLLTQVCVSGRVCVCDFVFTLDRGLRALYRSTCRGQQKRQL